VDRESSLHRVVGAAVVVIPLQQRVVVLADEKVRVADVIRRYDQRDTVGCVGVAFGDPSDQSVTRIRTSILRSSTNWEARLHSFFGL
jgi:hypothetical protein